MRKNRNVKLSINDDKTLLIQSVLETDINIPLKKLIYCQIYEDKITICCYNNQHFIYCEKTWFGSYYINLRHIANVTIVLSEYNREDKLLTLKFAKDGSNSIKKDYKHKVHIQLQFASGDYAYMSVNSLKKALETSLTEKSQMILEFLSNIDDDVLQQL